MKEDIESRPLGSCHEVVPAGEQAHIESLIHRLRQKMELDYEAGRTLRDAHPKMHGCVRGEFIVEPDLPRHLRVGIFARGQAYPAWIRFSNQSGTVSRDHEKDIRGAAIKLLNVPGEKLETTSVGDTTHDFILISESRFVTKDVAQFDALVGALTGGGARMIWFFLTHPRAARNLWTSLKLFDNPLTINYFSVAPYLLGSHAVKYSLRPHNGAGPQNGSTSSPDYLREAMVRHLTNDGAAFDFLVQYQADSVSMPIEDVGVTWDERASPFQKVATLRIAKQSFDTPERREFGDNLSFNPWRCLGEHRPLGGISRARRQVYRELARFRRERNVAPTAEPTVNDREWTS